MNCAKCNKKMVEIEYQKGKYLCVCLSCDHIYCITTKETPQSQVAKKKEVNTPD